MNTLITKLKDNSLAVAPIAAIVLILNFTISPLGTTLLFRFLIGSVFIIVGLSFFLIGVDIGITPLGSETGFSLAKSNKIWIVVAAGLIMGFFVSLAEPGLMVLANQVDAVTKSQISGNSLLVFVSVGLAIMLVVGFLRIIFNMSLSKMLIVMYVFIGAMAVFTEAEFIGIAFDASGATTGILAVPFILALGYGISSTNKNRAKAGEDCFGLVAMASGGAIIAVMVLNMVSKTTEFAAELEVADTVSDSVWGIFGELLRPTLVDGFKTLLPLLVIFVILQKAVFKLNRHEFRKIFMGFIFAYSGLTLFFLGVNGGFMDVGILIGEKLALLENKTFAIVIGFLIGFVTMLAEPAVYVLTHQIQDVTSGYVKRTAVLIPLCLGVGIAVALSVIRTLIPSLQLWHYLLPGYIIALGMTFFVPKLFVGIAFDAGGVATGPMTATFTLAFTQGVASQVESANLLVDGFGMIAMVALFPIITLQVLGLIFKMKAKKQEK